MPNYPAGVKNAQKNTWGGFQSATIYSGAVNPSVLACPGVVSGTNTAGGDVLLMSGGGRLDTFVPHLNTLHSGTVTGITFYDAGAVSSGGPFVNSGHKILWSMPSYTAPQSGNASFLSSGQVTAVAPLNAPITIGMPFQSGLVVACKSGQGGFSVAWTPEATN